MISVVIPTQNRLYNLRLALASIYNQTLLPREIIVVDDGSTPVVPENIFKNAPSSIKCILLHNEEPKGGNFTRNRGAETATGEYLAFLDDDDTWSSNKLEMQVNLMNSINLDLCYTGKQVVILKQNHEVLSSRYTYSYPRFSNLEKSIMGLNFIGTTSSIMVRREVFNKVGGLDSYLPSLQDYDFYIRLIFAGYNVMGINLPLVRYCIFQNNNAVSKSMRNHFISIKFLLKKFNRNKYFLSFVVGLFIITAKKALKNIL